MKRGPGDIESHLIPAREARIEMRVVNSRFIATTGPVFSVEEARSFIADIEREFDDATHNVPAYVIGHGPSTIAHCSDDGEPSGTAGAPALAVLQGSDLGDIAVVVTRYFGGKKLGTGGLVRAYGEAVRRVLSILPRAIKVATHTILVETPYNLFGQIERLIEMEQGHVIKTTFATEVTVQAQIPQNRFDEVQCSLQELSRGQIAAQIVASSKSTIMSLDKT